MIESSRTSTINCMTLGKKDTENNFSGDMLTYVDVEEQNNI
jgi:hypothetical protein